MNNVYRRQFMLCSRPSAARGVKSIACAGGLYLSYDEDLRLEVITGRVSGRAYILLGYAIQSLPGADDPGALLEREEFASLDDVISTWSGRWALITQNSIFTDVCGLMGLYYSTDAARGVVVSNSTEWMRREFGFDVRADYQPPKFGAGIDFLTGPSTALVCVKRLMNTEYLEIIGGALAPKPHNVLKKRNESVQRILEILNESLVCYFKNCSRVFPSIYLPLSGGYDSRASGAALIRSGAPFSAYTCLKRNMTRADRVMPQKLCKALGIRHEYILPNTNPAQRQSRLNEFDAYTGGYVYDRDREYYGNNQYPSPGRKPAMLVGGGVWPIANNIEDGKMADAISGDSDVESVFHNIKIANPFMKSLLADYIEYVKRNPLEFDIGFTYRFFFEQRIGCWLSQIEQAIDLTDCVRLQPLNCAYMLSLYMSLPRDYLSTCAAKVDLIRMNAPAWADFPFNQKTCYQIARSMLGRALRRCGLLHN